MIGRPMTSGERSRRWRAKHVADRARVRFVREVGRAISNGVDPAQLSALVERGIAEQLHRQRDRPPRRKIRPEVAAAE